MNRYNELRSLLPHLKTAPSSQLPPGEKERRIRLYTEMVARRESLGDSGLPDRHANPN